jgi:hypothetical protein
MLALTAGAGPARAEGEAVHVGMGAAGAERPAMRADFFIGGLTPSQSSR